MLYQNAPDVAELGSLFRRPTAEYRGTPFWAWNNAVDQAQLLRQIDCLKEMGFGGFHIHSRTGMASVYLGPAFLQAVRACADKAANEGMLCWLYDEDRWPSGFAGGLVTSDPALRAKFLLFTRQPYGGVRDPRVNPVGIFPRRQENGTLIGRYEVQLKEGMLAHYRRLKENEPPEADAALWYAYLETAGTNPWFNNQAYVDTLSRPAIERFIESTYEVYAQTVGDYFGTVVPSIFTDEPQFMQNQQLESADDQQDVGIGFAADFFQTYTQAYGQRLEEHLPELFWELPRGRVSVARYRYHDHISERFASAYADTLGRWCQRHGIALTGHLMEESTLGKQTNAVGEAMRSYRAFQIPGIDMLCDWREYNTAKQAQSAARQFGRPGVTSELYGVTDWDFDFAGYKDQGDWQAALGVTVRVPHLAWVSMAGEAKRDYPASISYQSPWYREYPVVEDHFARVNTLLTRGRPRVRVGVIHPIESYWLCDGPISQTSEARERREKNFSELTEWLLFGLVDFDFVSEALLPSQAGIPEGRQFAVGEMGYEVVIVPALRTIRSSTLDLLEAFVEREGRVIFMGEVPELVDAVPSARARELADRAGRVAFEREPILAQLEAHRDVSVVGPEGRPVDSLLYQMRQEEDRRYVFICNTDRHRSREDLTLRLAGRWQVEQWDTLSGESFRRPAHEVGNDTELAIDLPAHGSLLLVLLPKSDRPMQQRPMRWEPVQKLAGPFAVTLSEPNALLLDQAQWRIGDQPWQERDEILRIDNHIRRQLKIPGRTVEIAQPWVDREPAPVLGPVQLKFTVVSKVEVAQPRLACEGIEKCRLWLDGVEVATVKEGWFVDEAITTVALPDLRAGTHELKLEIPFTRKSELEWCYLLGDFGVQIRGAEAMVVQPVRQLKLGDWCGQGLPFYTGNVTYEMSIQGTGKPLALRVPKFKSPVLSVSADGKKLGPIAFSPYRQELGPLPAGEHQLALTVYGHRFNAFGCVHHTDPNLEWVGPQAWRSTGTEWTYEYLLKPMGLLSEVVIERGE